jgi:hypothetical protein
MRAQLSTRGARLVGLALVFAFVAACGTTGDGVELEPLVDGEEGVPLEPLVPDEDGVALEPLFEPGTDPSEAYHLEMTYTADGVLDLGVEISDSPLNIGSASIDSTDTFVGDVVQESDGVYRGRLHATSEGEGTAAVLGGEPCTSTWEGEQTVEAEAEVVEGDDADDVGALYLRITLTPVGTPQMFDPEDCDGPLLVDSLRFADHGLTSGLPIATTPRLPPPDYGKLEERDLFEVAEGRFEWVVAITPIDRSDADPDIDIIEGDLEPLAGDLIGPYEVEIGEGVDAGTYDGDLDAENSTCLVDEVFDGIVIEHDTGEAPRLTVTVMNLSGAESGTDEFDFQAAFDDEGRYYELHPAADDGTGEATVTMEDDSVMVSITGTTADGVDVDAEFRCDEVERTGS